MTEEELERIKSAYNSGLKVQIWSCGNWINFDAREYPYGGFSTNRQYRIVGDEYAEKAETEINRLKTENNKLLDIINNQDVKIADLVKQIEKMKCCGNCNHKKSEVDRCELLMYTMNACICKNKDKWELRR